MHLYLLHVDQLIHFPKLSDELNDASVFVYSLEINLIFDFIIAVLGFIYWCYTSSINHTFNSTTLLSSPGYLAMIGSTSSARNSSTC